MSMSMGRHTTGTDIVKEICGGRKWWQLRAADVQPWFSSVSPSTVETQDATCLIGEPWDHHSDIQIGQEVLLAKDVKALLARLLQHAASLDIPGLRLPDHNMVRCKIPCADAQDQYCAELDVYFGDFVVPIRVDRSDLYPGQWPKHFIHNLSERVIAAISYIAGQRDVILKDELTFRSAFEHAARTFGEGIAPIWLRMQAVRLECYEDDCRGNAYNAIVITLNQHLEWQPVKFQICDENEFRDHPWGDPDDQVRRAGIRQRMLDAGSQGSICAVAMALIKDHGLDPLEVFRQCIDPKLRSEAVVGKIELERAGNRECVFFSEGVLACAFSLDGAHYQNGMLILRGGRPESESLIVASKPLWEIVDHPALRACGRNVSYRNLDYALEIEHERRYIEVETLEGW